MPVFTWFRRKGSEHDCERLASFSRSATRVLHWFVILSCILQSAVADLTRARADETPDAHPLMPGIKSRELNNPDWPRTYHDRLVTGFSPLAGGMAEAPVLWSKIALEHTVDWVHAVDDQRGHRGVLVYDGKLRMVSPDGAVLWTNDQASVARSASAAVLHYGELRQNGSTSLLVADRRDLTLIDADSGIIEWTHRFEPAHVSLQSRPNSLVVADIRPDLPGLEAAIFPLYSERTYLINFPPEGDPRIVWDVLAIVPDEHAPGPGGGERADHGCWTQVDLSNPEEPVIWNVRHHRCRGFDPHTGEILSTLIYDIGGTQKRNYGPARLGFGRGGRRLMCVASEAVQFHVHGIDLNRRGPSTLLWQNYYGELLISGKPGRRELRLVAMDDVDFDGVTEIVYNLTDDSRDLRPHVIVRDGETGAIEAELADCRCEHAVVLEGQAPASWLVVRPTADGEFSTNELLLYKITDESQLDHVAVWPEASLWGPKELLTESGRVLLLRRPGPTSGTEIAQVALEPSGPRVVRESQAARLLQISPMATVHDDENAPIFVGSPVDGALQACDFEGRLRWTLEVSGAIPGMVSAADLNGDGRAELIAAAPSDQRVHIHQFDDQGGAVELRSHRHWMSDPRPAANPLAPLLYDLLGDGTLCLICPGQNADGHSVVRAFQADGSLLWESVLDPRQPAGPPTRWHAGQFLPGPRAAVVVSSRARQGETIQGTFLLDGATGEIVWQKQGYLSEHQISLPYYPLGVPTAFDLDGDGAEEIGMDFYCYMAWMQGSDGRFVRLHHTANLGQAGSLYAGRFHNSYIPVFPFVSNDSRMRAKTPYWLVPVGLYGAVGLMNPDPTDGVWREKLGYDMPRKIGMIDVDGDGRLEVGYAPHSQTLFTCRDMSTGEIEWQLELPEAPVSPVISADFDGDGRGEFLAGPYCVDVNSSGQGEIRWTLPEKLYFPVIADFDGDGHGEIAGFGEQGIRVYRGQDADDQP